MSELGIRLVWSALQITPVLVAALVISFLIIRHGPRAAASATLIALGVIAVLGVGNLLAWPDWLDLPRRAFSSQARDKDPPGPLPHAPAWLTGEGDSPPRKHWSNLRQRLARWQTVARGVEERLEDGPRLGWTYSELVAGAFLGVTGLACLHLFFGLWAVGRYRSRSLPIVDDALHEMLDRLRREMGCRQRVSLRESADVATPATVGWHSPLVLLPSGWRAWDESERQAVLAHELAHIYRADYQAGLLARVSVILHFYHPLVYWLANRLHLQQELAADALGARLGGGRNAYLRALANMALRQERQSDQLMARAFLAFPSMLFRRLTMLRVKESGPDQGLSLKAKVAVAGLLLLLGVGVTVLRGLASGPAATPRANPSVGAAQDNSAAAPVEPFEISFVPSDALGVIALRPKELSERSSIKLAAKAINEAIAEFQMCDGKGGQNLSLDAISQIIVKLQMPEFVEGNEGYLSFLRPNLIRTATPFAWKGLLQSTLPNLTEVNYLEKVYYRVTEPGEGKRSELFAQLFGPFPCFYIHDNRTLVCESEKNVRQYLRKKTAKEEKGSWRENWKRVERNLMAVALENRNNAWATSGPWWRSSRRRKYNSWSPSSKTLTAWWRELARKKHSQSRYSPAARRPGQPSRPLKLSGALCP